MAQYFISRDDL